MAATEFVKLWVQCKATNPTMWYRRSDGSEVKLATYWGTIYSNYVLGKAAAVAGETTYVGTKSLDNGWRSNPGSCFGTASGGWYDIGNVSYKYYKADGTYTEKVGDLYEKDFFKPNSYWGNGGSFNFGSVYVEAGTSTADAYATKDFGSLWCYSYFSYANYLASGTTGPESWAGSKTGYHCIGWKGNVSPINGNYGFEAYIESGTTTTEYTFSPRWEANTYYVRYNANGGSGSMGNSTHTYDASSNLSANTFTRSGYTFNGWNTQSDGKGTSYGNKASVKNLTSANGGTFDLYAMWAPLSYAITYNANGGNASSVPATQYQVQDVDLTLSEKPIPTRNDLKEYKTVTFSNSGGSAVGALKVERTTKYPFKNWNTAANGSGTSYSPGGKLRRNAATVLYAQWNSSASITKSVTMPGATKPNSVVKKKVTFDTQGGSAVNPIEYDVTTKYTFSQWTTNSTGGGTAYKKDAVYSTFADLVLYAQYTSGTTSAQVTLPPAPTKAGSIFYGWWTAKSGGTKRGDAGGKYTPPIGGELLYAQWILGTNVTFHRNDGSGSTETRLIRRNTSDNRVLTNPTRATYYFDGWNTKSNGTGVNVYNWTSITQCTGVNGSGYWNNNLWIYADTALDLYAKWVKAASYVYWTDGKWHPIKAYAYNGGWKETVTDYSGSGTSSFYMYDNESNSWKGGAS